MARNFFTHTTSAEFALTAATAKTVLQLLAATGVRLAIQAITLTFDGTSNTAEPVNLRLVRQTGAGTATSRAPQKKDTDIASALQVTGQENFTVEPTSDDAIVLTFHIHPQAGVQYPLPLPGEIIVPGAGRLGVKITAPANVNCLVTIEG